MQKQGGKVWVTRTTKQHNSLATVTEKEECEVEADENN